MTPLLERLDKLSSWGSWKLLSSIASAWTFPTTMDISYNKEKCDEEASGPDCDRCCRCAQHAAHRNGAEWSCAEATVYGREVLRCRQGGEERLSDLEFLLCRHLAPGQPWACADLHPHRHLRQDRRR